MSALPPITDVGRRIQVSEARGGLIRFLDLGPAGIDPATLSRTGASGAKPVRALSKNLEAVLEALHRAGVELADENTIRLTGKRRR